MSFSLENTSPSARTHDSDVSIIRREFVDLTGDLFSAVILNQLLYWTIRVKDFDHLLEEERQVRPECNVSPRHGWIYKTADGLNEETMLGVSHPTMRKYLKGLIDQGWIDERESPVEPWNKTIQYRVNLRKIQEDLSKRGRKLPHVYLKAFACSLPGSAPNGLQQPPKNAEETANVKNLHSETRNLQSDENSEMSFLEYSPESPEILNVRNLHSNERNLQSDENSEEPFLKYPPESPENPNVRNFDSNESCLHSNVKNFDSNVKNLHSYTYTENITENKNKDHTHRTRAREENFSPSCDNSEVDASIAQEMVDLWEQHIVQKLFPKNWKGIIQLNENRESQLESLFAFYFKDDIRAWERFCLRVKSIPFLMGEGPNGWYVTLDWIMKDRNLAKVLEGNYGGSQEEKEEGSYQVTSSAGTLEHNQAHPNRNPEKEAILGTIKDPIWRDWCTRLSQGVSLNELKFSHEPLSAFQLKQIANARFLEVEDERLVWIGSSDPAVLNAVENLRLQISWVFAAEHSKARAIRTRLDSETPLSLPQPLPQGENHHA